MAYEVACVHKLRLTTLFVRVHIMVLLSHGRKRVCLEFGVQFGVELIGQALELRQALRPRQHLPMPMPVSAILRQHVLCLVA